MLKEGQLVYYLVGSRVDQGHVIDIEQKRMELDLHFVLILLEGVRDNMLLIVQK